MRLTIGHETFYRFAEPAKHSIQYLRLTPGSSACQRVLSWSVSTPGTLTPWIDGFGNSAHVSTIDGEHDEIKVLVEGVVETVDTSGILASRDGLPPALFLRDTSFTQIGEATQALTDQVRDQIAGDTLSGLHALTNLIADKVTYTSGATTVETSAEEAVAAGTGVCQDHAHIFLTCARWCGIPSRYVSGYILAGQGNDSHVASHAWAESYIPGLGWVSFDPTNRQSATEEYVRLAIGFDYMGAAPVRGSRLGGGVEELSVRVQVEQTQS
jgi:transglutaminase-like putative cysteine protease